MSRCGRPSPQWAYRECSGSRLHSTHVWFMPAQPLHTARKMQHTHESHTVVCYNSNTQGIGSSLTLEVAIVQEDGLRPLHGRGSYSLERAHTQWTNDGPSSWSALAKHESSIPLGVLGYLTSSWYSIMPGLAYRKSSTCAALAMSFAYCRIASSSSVLNCVSNALASSARARVRLSDQ